MSAHDSAAGSEGWILAFDASCGTCQEISDAVSAACEDKVTVLPLNRPDVLAWRESALGSEAPWAPTLIKTRHGRAVQAWTGRGIAVPLARRLGARATVRVLNALGRLKQEVRTPLSASVDADRRRFLRFGAGAAMVGGLLVTGAVPALAAERKKSAADWVAANAHRLPKSYDEFSAFTVHYRREIHRALTTPQRAALWREHLKRYRAKHASPSAAQRAALDRVERHFADESVFDLAQPRQSARVREETNLRTAMTDAFDAEEAFRVLAMLGPAPARAADVGPAALCECSTANDWCGQMYFCYRGGCDVTPDGCGTGWTYACDGMCGT